MPGVGDGGLDADPGDQPARNGGRAVTNDEPIEQPSGAQPSGAQPSGAQRSGSQAPEEGPRLQLYLLRHADAGDPAAWPGDDADRPLSKKGRRQARGIGQWLQSRGKLPGIVVTSPKVRAAQTAGLATEGSSVTPIVDERLAAGFGLEDVAGIVRDHAPEARRVMLVGHDPDFSELASDLVGGKIELKKGAVARIDLAGAVQPGAGTLRWLVPPEALAED
jgi:phosphohistidine phosphatase